jgi:hypothetical protein
MMNAARLVWVLHYTAGSLSAAQGGPGAPGSVGFFAGGGAAPFVSVTKTDDPFWPVFVADSRSMGVDPRDVAAVMLAESGLNPRAANVQKGVPVALGINQLAGASNWAKFLGPLGLSPDDYLNLPASVQWTKVAGPFFRGVVSSHPGVRGARAENRARDLYWLNYRPATYVEDAPEDFPIIPWKSGDGDSVLVLPGDNAIRPAGLRAFLMKAQAQNAPRWASILAAIDATEAGLGPAPLPQQRDKPAPGPGRGQEAVASEGLGLGKVLAIGAGIGAVWFVVSSYRAAGRLKTAVVD